MRIPMPKQIQKPYVSYVFLYAQNLILVNLMLVNFFGCVVITRYHTMRF